MTVLTAPGVSNAAFSTHGDGTLTAQALSLTEPPKPTVETTFALGCLLGADVKISWDDPPPGTTYRVYTTAGEPVTGKVDSKGSTTLTVTVLTNYKLRVEAGPWYKDSAPGACKIVIDL